jgi:hypothetical protein
MASFCPCKFLDIEMSGRALLLVVLVSVLKHMMLERFILFLCVIEYEVTQGHLGCLQPLILKMLHLRMVNTEDFEKRAIIILHIVEAIEYLLVLGTLLLPLGCVMFPEYVL